MVVPLAHRLSTAGFSQYTIGVGPNPSNQALALLYHPEGGSDFATRQAFLERETGLHISLQADIPDNNGDQQNHQEPHESHFDRGWGRARVLGENPTRLMLGVYCSVTPENLNQAFETAWNMCTQFETIRWDLNSFTLGLSPLEVSMTLFRNIQTRWQTAPGNPSCIYFPIESRSRHHESTDALKEIFGTRKVKKPKVKKPNPQLSLFG